MAHVVAAGNGGYGAARQAGTSYPLGFLRLYKKTLFCRFFFCRTAKKVYFCNHELYIILIYCYES